MYKKIKNKFIFLSLSLFLLGIFGCGKDEIQPVEYFSMDINEVVKEISTKKATISKGITVIAAYELKKNKKSTIIINIHGAEKGIYKQEYDYKTSVSVTQCALTYKIMSKSYDNEPQYYASYEGVVNITGIDKNNKNISGSYCFKVKAVPDDKNIKEIKGKFVNLNYK